MHIIERHKYIKWHTVDNITDKIRYIEIRTSIINKTHIHTHTHNFLTESVIGNMLSNSLRTLYIFHVVQKSNSKHEFN